jgi:hypothetical protein
MPRIMDDRWEKWSIWWNEICRGNRSTRRKPAPFPLSRSESPRERTWDTWSYYSAIVTELHVNRSAVQTEEEDARGSVVREKLADHRTVVKGVLLKWFYNLTPRLLNLFRTWAQLLNRPWPPTQFLCMRIYISFIRKVFSSTVTVGLCCHAIGTFHS